MSKRKVSTWSGSKRGSSKAKGGLLKAPKLSRKHGFGKGSEGLKFGTLTRSKNSRYPWYSPFTNPDKKTVISRGGKGHK